MGARGGGGGHSWRLRASGCVRMRTDAYESPCEFAPSTFRVARRLPPPLAVEQFFKVLGEFEAGETEPICLGGCEVDFWRQPREDNGASCVFSVSPGGRPGQHCNCIPSGSQASEASWKVKPRSCPETKHLGAFLARTPQTWKNELLARSKAMDSGELLGVTKLLCASSGRFCALPGS